MASTVPTTWSQLTSVTREKVLPKVIDEITKEHPVLAKLFAGAEQLDGGNRIEAVIKYKNSTQGGSYAGLEPLDATQEQTRTRAYFTWKQYEQPIVISNIDIAKNGGAGKVFDIVTQEMNEAKVDLKDKFATALYAAYASAGVTGNSGKDLDSLIGAVDDGTANTIYGGITRGTTGTFDADNSNWWNGSVDASTTILSLAAMRTAWSAASDGSDTPDMIVTTPTQFDKYEALLTNTLQFQTNTGRGGVGDASFTSLSFRGAPIISDKYATAGAMYLLNTKYVKMYTLKHPDYPTSKEGFAMTDLRRPDTQDGKLGYILWYGNLVCTMPKRQARFSGLL